MMMGLFLIPFLKTRILTDEDPEGFIPIDYLNGNYMIGEADDNRSVHSAQSNSSHEGWVSNPNLLAGNSAACRSALRDLAGGFGHTQDVLQSLKSALFNGIPVVKPLTSLWRTKNGKTECSNIAAVVAELEKEGPMIFAAVLELSTFTGHHAREKLNTAFDMLYDYASHHS